MGKYEMSKLGAGVPIISKAGHDAGKWYIVVSVDDRYVYLSDGKLRPVEKPKKKKIKHIQPVTSRFMEEELLNENIRRWLKNVEKEN